MSVCICLLCVCVYVYVCELQRSSVFLCQAYCAALGAYLIWPGESPGVLCCAVLCAHHLCVWGQQAVAVAGVQ